MKTNIVNIENRNILTVEDNEGRLFQLSSMYHADKYQKIWARESLSTYRHAKYFVFGLGDGSYLAELLKVIDDDSLVFVYEPSEEIYNLTNITFQLDSILSDDRIRFYNNIPDNFATEISKLISFSDAMGIRITAYPNYKKLFSSEYEQFEVAINYASSQAIYSINTVCKNGNTISYNIINNLKILETSYTLDNLKPIISHRPLLVIGAGPSLNDAIPFLEELRKKCTLLCVDSALPTLMKHNIIPDYFISVDPIKEEYNFTDPRIQQIPGIFPLTCRNFIFKNRTANNFFISGVGNYATPFEEANNFTLPNVASSSSVGNYAFAVAIYLGIKNIFLTGLDMAFKDNLSHASGAYCESISSAESKAIVSVPSVTGEMIFSNMQMNFYREEIERNIVLNPEITVYNTSKSGANIEGAINTPVEELLKKFEDTQLNNCLPAPQYKDFSSVIKQQYNDEKAFMLSLGDLLNKLNSIDSENINNNESKILVDACESLYQFISNNRTMFPVHCLTLHKIGFDIIKIYRKTNQKEVFRLFSKYFTYANESLSEILNMQRELFL